MLSLTSTDCSPSHPLEQLCALIKQRFALHFSPARRTMLQNAVAARQKRTGVDTLPAYCTRLDRDPAELQSLVEEITTKETYFFRLPGQFQALRERILPDLEERLALELRQRLARGWSATACRVPLRIWSAGCATGEEPYSIAMTLLDTLKYPRAWQLEILATDISNKALRTARAGRYPAEAGDRIPSPLRHRFTRELEGDLAMTSSLNQLLSFGVLNLRDLAAPGATACSMATLDGDSQTLELQPRFDLIFCRNVLIYFDLETQQRLVEGLERCLRPGGCLFTGDAEPMHLYRHGLQVRTRGQSNYYEKPPTTPTRPEESAPW